MRCSSVTHSSQAVGSPQHWSLALPAISLRGMFASFIRHAIFSGINTVLGAPVPLTTKPAHPSASVRSRPLTAVLHLAPTTEHPLPWGSSLQNKLTQQQQHSQRGRAEELGAPQQRQRDGGDPSATAAIHARLQVLLFSIEITQFRQRLAMTIELKAPVPGPDPVPPSKRPGGAASFLPALASGPSRAI